MHVRELVELSALVAVHGRAFMQYTPLMTDRYLQQYWLAARGRHDRWFCTMKHFERASPLRKVEQWPEMRAIIEEVLASEMLTRIWSALGCSFDRQHDRSTFAPVVRSVLAGHVEARNRSLHVLVRGEGFRVEDARALNRLRNHTERWTDRMLGYLARDYDVDEFAFVPELTRDFAADLSEQQRTQTDVTSWQLTLASLRRTYRQYLTTSSPNGTLNRRIASSIVACFQDELHQSHDAFKSGWLLRLNQVTEEALGLIEHLLHIEDAASGRLPLHR